MATYHRKTADERRAEVDALTSTLMDGVSSEVASGDIQKILDNIANFQYNYSLNNSLLIYLQNPEASTVGSYTSWQKVNRQVESGQKGIKILCPVKYKYEAETPVLDVETHKPIYDSEGNVIKEKRKLEGISYKIGYVFDITQTKQMEGKLEIPLEPVKRLTGTVGEQYQDLMIAAAEASPVPIEIENIHSSANGYFSRDTQTIKVQEGMSEQQTLKTTIHEVAHSYLHNAEVDAGGNLSYFVAANAEFPRNFEGFQEGLQLSEAIEAYKQLPDNHGKVIGVDVETAAGESKFIIVADGKIQNDYVNDIAHLRESLDVQKAMNDLAPHFEAENKSIPTMREIQAEGTAYVVAKHYGIDTSEYSLRYVAAWSDMDPDKVMDNLNAIKACSAEIIDKMDQALEKIQAEREINEILSDKELASKLDDFAKTHDWYEYKDTESYPGSNYDQLLSDIRSGRTEGIKDYLKEVVSDNRGMVSEAKDLLGDIEKHEQSHQTVETTDTLGRSLKI